MLQLDYQNRSDAHREDGRGFAGLWRWATTPGHADAWRAAADAVGGRYVAGGWRRPDRVEADVGPWTVTLAKHVVRRGKSTRVQTWAIVPYVADVRFQCSVTEHSLFAFVADWLGYGDVRVGDRGFDAAFALRGNDPERVRDVFADPTVKALVAAQPRVDVRAEARDVRFAPWHPGRVDRLVLRMSGDVRTVEHLAGAFRLCAATVRQLHRVGVARPVAVPASYQWT